MFIVKYVFLNVFIAIILEGFSDTLEADARFFNNDSAELFKNKWSIYDNNVSI
jgi:hypothetical protein